MAGALNGVRVAAIATDGFEQVELTEPKKALEQAGATVHVISDKTGEIQGFNHVDKGDKVRVDVALDQARAQEYDALLLPGGVVNGDAVRLMARARDFAKQIDAAKKPIAVICHGGWVLVSAGLVKGRTMTSWPSLQDDIRNAGGAWVDEEVHTDGNLISSRKPDDIPAFNRALLGALEQAKAGKQPA